MKAVCTKNKRHSTFVTVATVLQEWQVDRGGNFLSELDVCVEVVGEPSSENNWVCFTCGAPAIVKADPI